MNDDRNRLDPSKYPAALKRLIEHLIALDTQDDSDFFMESDMLSLVVSKALNGEDIARLYPDFYQKLLGNTELRQAFLDALESVEAERANQQAPMPVAQTQLDFLTGQSISPTIEVFDKNKWRASLQRTLEQLRSIFSPPTMAYRADPNLIEDPWFTLLREEMIAEGVTYDVMLDCTLSNEKEYALSAFLNLAVTLESNLVSAAFPLRASLHWGEYQESVLIPDEGRFRFPDIPMVSIFDEAGAQPKAGFNLTLETAS